MLNLYDEEWPVRTLQQNLPPAKFVFGSHGDSQRQDQQRAGMALDSIVCAGTIVSGGKVERSILSPKVRVNSYASVTDSILFDGVEVGRHAKIRGAIIDKGVRIPAGMQIGFDLELDRRRGFTISPEGIVVIAKQETISPMDSNLFLEHGGYRLDQAEDKAGSPKIMQSSPTPSASQRTGRSSERA